MRKNRHHDILNTLTGMESIDSDGGALMLHILICDDELSFIEQLRQSIELLPTYNKRAMKITCANDPHKLKQSVIRESDIVFLDIDMGDVNGIAIWLICNMSHQCKQKGFNLKQGKSYR